MDAEIGVFTQLDRYDGADRKEGAEEFIGDEAGEFDHGGAAAYDHEHAIFDELDGFAGDLFFFVFFIDVSFGIGEMEGFGDGAAVYFDDLTAVREFVEVAADGIFRNVQFHAEVGRQDFVVDIYLTDDVF